MFQPKDTVMPDPKTATTKGPLSPPPEPIPSTLDGIIAAALTLLILAVILRDTTTIEFMRPASRVLLITSLVVFVSNRASRRWPFFAAGVALSLWVAATASDPQAILFPALDSAAFVAAFFAALGALRHAAELSLGITRAAQYLADRPPGWRYLALMAGGQAFSLLLGYGAISLLGALVVTSTADESDPHIRAIRRKRMLLAVQHGFVSNICWSPMSFGMILALALVPGSTWISALPWSLTLALMLCALAWSLDWIMKPPRRGLPLPDHGSRPRDLLPLMGLLALLTLSLILCHSIFGLRASVSVMIIVPLLSLAWIGASAPLGQNRLLHITQEGRNYAMAKLPSFGNEIVLLSLASFLGTAGGQALAPMVSRLVDLQSFPAPVLLLSLVWLLPLMGYLGAHPLLSVSLLYPLFPDPAQMGVSPTAVVCAITAGWAISGATSPFTAAALLIGRFANVSPFTVGAIWNGPYTLAALSLASGWVTFLASWL